MRPPKFSTRRPSHSRLPMLVPQCATGVFEPPPAEQPPQQPPQQHSVAPTTAAAPAPAADGGGRRVFLKARRSLSAFTMGKSRSFTCIANLASNPFSQSTLLLAKRRHSDTSSGSVTFGVTDDDGELCASSSIAPAAKRAAVAAPPGGSGPLRLTLRPSRSWDGGDCWQQQQQGEGDVMRGPAQTHTLLRANTPAPGAMRRAASPALSGSADSSDTDCLQLAPSVTCDESLCAAMRAAVLAL